MREIFESFQMVSRSTFSSGPPLFLFLLACFFFPFFLLLFALWIWNASTLVVGTMATFFYNILFFPLFCSSNTSQTRSYLLTTKLTNNRGHAAGGIEFNTCVRAKGVDGWSAPLWKRNKTNAVKFSNGRNGFVIKDIRKSGWVINQSDVLKSVISSN